MLFKVLLPALVGVLVYFLGKSHARRERRPPPISATLQGRIRKKQGAWHDAFRVAAYVLAGSAVFSAGWFIYQDWAESQKTVTIRVINAQTGESTHYQARQAQVYGRTFRTVEGHQVRLADVERMEVVPDGAGLATNP